MAAPITYLSKDDPPALLDYRFADEEVDENTPLGLIVHHPKFGIALKKRMNNLGIKCIVQYVDKSSGKIVRHGARSDTCRIAKVDFIKRSFEAAKNR